MRPRSAEKPGPGQESVWDYPRPPIWQHVSKRLRIVFGGTEIATTGSGIRVLETSHPPVYYLPPDAFLDGALEAVGGASFCEFKGEATYFDVVNGERRAPRAAWCYRQPVERFAVLRDYVAVYASAMDACFVGDERVAAQEGDFYGGWITSKVVGPFKGGAGTWGW